MNIFILGFMGSGKSTLGKKLANRLKMEFTDLDVEIEKQEKKTVNQIFTENGEHFFRTLETNWLENFKRNNTVIATGGGTPCYENNLEIIQKKGITIYLKSSSENLTNRLYQSKNLRPLIEEIKDDKTALLEFVRSKLTERTPFYEKCALTIDSIDIDSDKLNLLVKKILEYGTD